MKTKVRTIITVCLLAFAGVLNANATENASERNSAKTNTNENLNAWNGELTMFDAEFNVTIDYQKEAQLVTRWIADRTEEKVTQQLIERNLFSTGETTGYFENEVSNENNGDITDFRKEAQLVTKALADKQEANAIEKLVTEGKLVENR